MSNYERLAEIRQRLSKATPAPWKADVIEVEDKDGITVCRGWSTRGDADVEMDNMDFIAHSPDDIAFLLDLAQQGLDLRTILPQDVLSDAIMDDPRVREATQRETARECIRIIYQTEVTHVWPKNTSGNTYSDKSDDADRIAKAIRDRFGV